MREIKFRYWNKQAKKYHYGQVQVLSCLSQQTTGLYDHESDGCRFEQYTGLHDKNGREIYEGDVIKSQVLLSGEYVNNEVRWIDCGFIANGLLGRKEAELSEVLGNIHENPELLA